MKWNTKIASLLVLAAAVLVSCEDKADPAGGSSIRLPDLAISFDKNIIQNDGTDAVTFKAYYKNEDVSDKATFYRNIPDKLVPEVLSSRVFTSTTVGSYKFKVGYMDSYSDEITVTVTSKTLPSAVADPQPANVSFVHRAFLNQYTGAGCGYCPYMIRLLRQTLVDEVADKAVLASLRTYGGEDGFAMVPNPSSAYPYLHIDYHDDYDSNLPSEGLAAKINAIAEAPAKVGISANPVYFADEKQIAVRVVVKAAQKGEYNVGLWLMQDNYYKIQKDSDHIGDSSYNYHDNCVRVADSNYLGYHIGFPLGILDRGETGEWVFMFDLKDAIEKNKSKGGWWESFSNEKLNDLHFAAFVTTPVNTPKGVKYEVVNAIDFPYNTPAPSDYK
jgi:hypothetical protein